MQNKLQELTEKLYSEGLSKGKQEAEEIKSKALKEAEEILVNAREEAKNIVSNAKKESDEIKSKISNEVQLSSKQLISTLKQEIESILIKSTINEAIKFNLSDKEFIAQLIISAVKSFNPNSEDNSSLEVILPENLKTDTNKFLKDKLSSVLKSQPVLTFDNRLTNGFKISPKDGTYFISFTEKDFQDLLGQFLRPKTKEMLFETK